MEEPIKMLYYCVVYLKLYNLKVSHTSLEKEI